MHLASLPDEPYTYVQPALQVYRSEIYSKNRKRTTSALSILNSLLSGTIVQTKKGLDHATK